MTIVFSQQDAQEFLRSLLDALHSEVNRATPPPTTSSQDFDHLWSVPERVRVCVCVCLRVCETDR